MAEPEQPIVTYMCFSGGGGGERGKGGGKRKGRVKNVYQIFWVSWSLNLSFFAKLSHNLKFVVEILKKNSSLWLKYHNDILLILWSTKKQRHQNQ